MYYGCGCEKILPIRRELFLCSKDVRIGVVLFVNLACSFPWRFH